MRLIDADRFKEYIRKGAEVSAPYYKYKTTLQFAKEMSEAFCEDIDEQPTVNLCGQRIPADRPPEMQNGKSKTILISFEDCSQTTGIYKMWEDGKAEYTMAGLDVPFSVLGLKVNGWMPLPESLREQSWNTEWIEPAYPQWQQDILDKFMRVI